jgi:predicted phosphodiesterase
MSLLRLPRTLVLSDLHLGRPSGVERAEAFETLLADFDRVIVNGDVAELHHAAFQADAELQLAIFRDICVSRGIKLDLIAGNHDPFVSETRSISLADGAIYVTHGDAFHPAVAPWSPFARTMRSAFDAALAGVAPGTADDTARFIAAREAAIAEWRVMGEGAHISTITSMAAHPGRALAVLRYWASYPGLATDWAERYSPQSGTVIVGHSHRAFHRNLQGRHIVNTGAFGFPGRPHAVVIEGTTLRLHPLVKRGHYFALSGDARAAWPIAFHARGVEKLGAQQASAQATGASAASTVEMKREASASMPRLSDTR